MAAIRVHLLTCNRPHLLPRALASLRAQTFTDWVCEVHNDAPGDPAPGKAVRELDDPRIKLINHAHNLGGVGSFNAIHRPIAETYFSILEDDNWWEPDLLGALVDALEQTPSAAATWANMRIWTEGSGGTWHDTGRCIWPVSAFASHRLFHWAQPLQFNDALHSNGAMLLRAPLAEKLVIPESTPFDMMEALRERLIPHPLLLVPRPLANYAMTSRTARSHSAVTWGQCKALLGAAFLLHARLTRADISRIWTSQRRLKPRSTGALFWAAWLVGRFSFLRGANTADWSLFWLQNARHPVQLWCILQAKRVHGEVWRRLNQALSERFAETRAHGRPDVETAGVASREENLPC
jgi:glycosyltransferase involved in cell wall biosynthesis